MSNPNDKAVETLSKLVVSAAKQILSAYPLPVLLTFAAGETVTLLAEQNNFQHMVILS